MAKRWVGTLKISSLLLLLVTSGKFTFDVYKKEFSGKEFYNSIEEEIVSEEIEGNAILPTPKIVEFKTIVIPEEVEKKEQEEVSEEVEEIVNEPVVEKEQISSTLLESGYPFKTIDFESAKERCGDVTAWIDVVGSQEVIGAEETLSYPIMHAPDEENLYYLKHDIDGNASSYGAIFSDYYQNRLDSDMEDLTDFTFIYGHQMKNGTMFATARRYASQEFYDKYPYWVIYTPDGYAYQVEFFSGIPYSGNDVSAYELNMYESKEEFEKNIQDLKNRSTFKSDVEVNYRDKIVVMVTCYGASANDERFMLFGVIHKQYTNANQIEIASNQLLLKGRG